MIPLINPHRLALTGQWYSHENSDTATIPTNSNSGKISYDTEASFYKFKMSFTTSISWGGGNWNGSVACYAIDLDVG